MDLGLGQLLLILFLFAGTSLSSDSQKNCTTNEKLDNRLCGLREIMANLSIDAYIIPHSDNHDSEQLAPPEERIRFISGFSGSTGRLIVTKDRAILQTDGRYTIQAREELPCQWSLGTLDDVLNDLPRGSDVSIDANKINWISWNKTLEKLTNYSLNPVYLDINFVDEIWAERRPRYNDNYLFIHDLKYSGESHRQKLSRVRNEMKKIGADLLIGSALDDTAWLLNLRGSDVPFSPVFTSYLLLTLDDVKLYLPETTKINAKVARHLGNIVSVRAYKNFLPELEHEIKKASKVFIPSTSSYLIYSKVPPPKRYSGDSPIASLKASKNPVEIQGAKNSQLRDAVALCRLMRTIEVQVPAGLHWDELKISQSLNNLRKQQKLNMGIAYTNIVAYGKNAALPHYSPTEATNSKIGTDRPMYLDTGGQYLDGTIDTTRTLHLGCPTAWHKKVYTSILKGCIDLVTHEFPEGTHMSSLEEIARKPLRDIGLEYSHGTTHGTGIYLNVHEFYNGTLFKYFIGSQEPGYYEKDNFGMRLENLVLVVPSPNQNSTNRLLTFQPLTLVPYESKLIDTELLEEKHVEWINCYHAKVLTDVGDEMIKQGEHDLYVWLKDKTEPILRAMPNRQP